MDEIISHKEHSLNYSRNQLTLTGVLDVQSFSDREVFVKLEDRGITIKGKNLSVSELNVKSGFLKLDGVLDSFIYQTREKLSIIKKLFQ
ncbi:MAG: YabP/YqfC family sporulation protein [Christensenellaceae bacterium]|nr:YabP/YqfC family sporulation protein [Christensenellaceae bacterium]